MRARATAFADVSRLVCDDDAAVAGNRPPIALRLLFKMKSTADPLHVRRLRLHRGWYLLLLSIFLISIMWHTLRSISTVAVLPLLTETVAAVSPVVHLNYTSYRGTSLANGVTQWLGVRYAAPPVGDLRFREPEPPETEDGVVDADSFKPICLGTDAGPPSNESAEDCLYLNIFAPSTAKKKSKLPVYFFIQGGGFNTNSNANYNGSGLVTASDMNIVVVNFNYRGTLAYSNSHSEVTS